MRPVELPASITAHALVRWLERVEMIDLAVHREDGAPDAIVLVRARDAGVDVDRIVRAIERSVRVGIEMGASAVRRGRTVLHIKQSRVCTVTVGRHRRRDELAGSRRPRRPASWKARALEEVRQWS